MLLSKWQVCSLRQWCIFCCCCFLFETNLCYPCDFFISCPPNGFANISSCLYGAPVGISLPHFLYADDVYHKTVTGMSPDPVKHEAYADIVTEFGFPIKVSPKLQLNVVLERDSNVHVLANMTQERIYFPVMWLEVVSVLK